ncbi:winged helix-turn-helix transcriptional regulator [Candidatus Pacearchaeota archaeon]|nr:winged helix-turn-helix transcriptional regulator [Candidatus Pacearchaeota archaeon]
MVNMPPKFLSKKDKILKLEKRREIYEFVNKNSGCHFRDIERKLRIPGTSLRYHLNYLTKHNLLSAEKFGNNVRYFSKELTSENKQLLGLLRQNSMRKIVLCILKKKNCTFEDVAEFVNLSPSTVSFYLKKLEPSIIKRIFNKKSHYSIAIDEKEILNLLITYKESFMDKLVNNVIEMWDVS